MSLKKNCRAIGSAFVVGVALVLAAGCSGGNDEHTSTAGSGGTPASGGRATTGGAENRAGAPTTGGSESQAGAATGGNANELRITDDMSFAESEHVVGEAEVAYTCSCEEDETEREECERDVRDTAEVDDCHAEWADTCPEIVACIKRNLADYVTCVATANCDAAAIYDCAEAEADADGACPYDAESEARLLICEGECPEDFTAEQICDGQEDCNEGYDEEDC